MADEPVLLVVDDIADDILHSPFGERWGWQVITLTKEHLQSLQAGKLLAVDAQGEYVVYLKADMETAGYGEPIP